MKLFPADLPGFLDELARWTELSIEARRAFVDGTVPGLSVDPAVGGSAVAELHDAGFLQPSRRGELLEIAGDLAGFHHVLKSLARCPVFERPGLAFLSAYLGEHYTPQERSQIHESVALLPNDLPRVAGLVSSVEWLRTALGPERADGRTARPGHPSSSSDATVRALSSARRLLAFFTEQRDRVALRDLEEYFPGVPREELCDGVRMGMQRCLFYLGLRHADLEPLVGIWPAAARRLRRLAVVLAPEPVRVPEVFGHPFLVEDMASLLVASGRQPIPLRRGDEKPFARFVEDTSGMLLTLPAWLESLSGLTLENRVDLALQALRLTGLLQDGPGAEQWIGRGPGERRDLVVDRLLGSSGSSRLFDLLEDDLVSSADREGSVLPWLKQAFSSVPARTFIRFSDFAEYQAAIGSPLSASAAGAGSPSPGTDDPAPGDDAPEFASEEALEELWKSFLGVFLGRCLVSLGGAQAGATEDGRPAFRLTDTGRRLLGLPWEVLQADPGESHYEEAPLVVQPNFEVVFFSPSPEAEAELGRFCERLGRGIGVLFRISRPSLQRAAAAGIAPALIISALKRRSRSPLPANVEHEIRGWADPGS
ncbi:MAG TPA: helicase-associated domain-containing protein [Spirochaetia bacterium]|nr:helicase-associated domain-containing protein [Spirochaetia bacterium]